MIDLLIFHPRMIFTSSLISNGALVLASYVASKGFNVRVVDDNSHYLKYSHHDYLELISKYHPKILGISIGMFNAFAAYQLVRSIRAKFKNQIIILGGMHAYDSDHEMVRNDVDAVFKGEAELSIVRFMELIEKFNLRNGRRIFDDPDFIAYIKKIPGILCKAGPGIIDTGDYQKILNLDTLPFLNHGIVNLKDYIRGRYDNYRVTNCINFQRGCPYQCIYCKADFMRGKIRNNSPVYMFNQLLELYTKFGTDQFNITDANFPIDKNRMHEFCHLMISSGLSKSVKMWYQTSVTIPLEDESLALLRKAGFTMISVGIERFDTDFRRYMRKAGSSEQAYDVIKRIKKNKLKTNVNILVNFPGDTIEALVKESSYIEQYLPFIDYCGVFYLVPVPGTALNDPTTCDTQWYLRSKIANKIFSYYDLAYNVTTPGPEFNIFRLSEDVLLEMRMLKEKFYEKSISRMNHSFFFKIGFLIDMVLARISFQIYRVSSRMEHTVFSPLKYLRIIGAKIYMNKYVMGKVK